MDSSTAPVSHVKIISATQGPAAGTYSNHPATVAAGGSTEQDSDMHAMLRDAFEMHEVREDNCELEVMVQGGEEIVNEEAAKGDALKYYDLLKMAEKPLHGSKLSATLHLYDLKYVGGLSNTIFSELLEFII